MGDLVKVEGWRDAVVENITAVKKMEEEEKE